MGLMKHESCKRPFARPEVELLTIDGDVLTTSGGEPEDGGWGQVWPIG